MHLVFLHGPPGVGKLTVARALAERSGLRVFHNHLTVDLLGSLFAFGSEPFVRLREEIWLGAFREAARSGTSLVFTFAPERTVRPGFPARAAETVTREGGRPLFVELVCEDAEIERRIESPDRRAFGKLASADRYRELRAAGAFDYEGIEGGADPIDTGRLDPASAAREIARRLGEDG